MNSVDCKSPVVVVNPRWNEDVCHFNHLHAGERDILITPYHISRLSDFENVFSLFGLYLDYRNVSDQELDQWYFYDGDIVEVNLDSDGVFEPTSTVVPGSYECSPLFIKVPCGKCEVCKYKKQLSLVQRLMLASQEAAVVPMFLTLTYNDVAYPPGGVCKDDVVKFKKRFRTYAERFLHFSSETLEHIKFACFSEYGKDTHRAHYHCLIFGLPRLDDADYNNLLRWTRFIRFCWRFGISDCRDVDATEDKPGLNSFEVYEIKYPQVFMIAGDYDPLSMGYVNVKFTSSSKALAYVSKYCTKGADVPEGCNPLMRPLISQYLGFDFVKKNFNYDEYIKDMKMSYLDVFNNRKSSISLSAYYLNKLFPSWSNLITVDFRRHYYSAVTHLQTLVKTRYLDINLRQLCLHTLDSIFEKFPFMPLFEVAYPDLSDNDLLHECQVATENMVLDLYSYKPVLEDDDFYCPLYFYIPSLADDLIYLENTTIDYDNVLNIIKKRSFLFNKFTERDDIPIRALRYKENLSNLKSRSKL